MERTTIRVPVAIRSLLKVMLRWSPSENIGRLVGDMAVQEADRLVKAKGELMSNESRKAIYGAMADVCGLERGRVTKESIE